MNYYGVDEITLIFAKNGCMIQFWGRYGDPEEMPEKYSMVFPDIKTALEVVEAIKENNLK